MTLRGLARWLAVAGLSGCGYPPLPAVPTGDTGDTAEASSSSTAAADSTGDEVEATVTYHEHIRPLLERHCVSCHQPGRIAPFALTTYGEAHDLREAVRLAIEARTMPPWMPAPGCRTYRDDPSLSEEEIAAVGAWVDQGAAEGSPEAYVPPMLPSAPGLSRVDLSLQLPEPYTPQAGPDDYRCFLLDWPHDETTFVTGFMAEPDRQDLVHHMIAFEVRPAHVGHYQALDAAEPGPGYTCFGGPGGPTGGWLGAWAPGSVTGDFPEGTGLQVDPGARVVLQVHYNTAGGAPQPDHSGISLKLDAEVERPAAMLVVADPDWVGGDMPIPAGEPAVQHAYEFDPTLFMDDFTDVIPPLSPFVIHSASHHMHRRGSRGRQLIERDDGTEECLVELPRWDFDWQQRYRFEQPLLFEPGDELRVECQWDNSGSGVDVNWGEGTDDEMCLMVLYLTMP